MLVASHHEHQQFYNELTYNSTTTSRIAPKPSPFDSPDPIALIANALAPSADACRCATCLETDTPPQARTRIAPAYSLNRLIPQTALFLKPPYSLNRLIPQTALFLKPPYSSNYLIFKTALFLKPPNIYYLISFVILTLL